MSGHDHIIHFHVLQLYFLSFLFHPKGLSMLLLFLVNKQAYQELKWLKQDRCYGLFTWRRLGRELNVTMEMTVEQALELDAMSIASKVDVTDEEMQGNEEGLEKEEVTGNEEGNSKEAGLTDDDGEKPKQD